MGPMFRRERPQKGRFRQFYQIGAEAIGSESPVVDAEVIEMVVELLRRAGMEGFNLLINSVGDANCRPAYLALLREQLEDVAPKLCGDCQRRATTNPLRVLDCKVPDDQPYIDNTAFDPRSSVMTHAANISRPCGRTWTPAGSPMKSARGWSAAWITTCARRLRSRTGHWERRIPFWAGAL